MTARQIALVKRTWKIISKINPGLVGDVFYSKLFLDTPQLKPMFEMNRQEQAKKLVNMLHIVVTRLERLEELKDDIQQLAVRHKKYGVANWHYDKAGHALLWTLERALGPDFDVEIKQAWTQCYIELADAMINAVPDNNNVSG